MKLTNRENIPTPMAVFLASDDYDYDPRPNAISATGLLKSTKQIILSKRALKNVTTIDIADLIPASLGNAVHNGIEAVWKSSRYKTALRNLGRSEEEVNRIVINPNSAQLKKDTIPVYVELRREKEIEGFILTGKFDFVGDGVLIDYKTTGTYSFISGGKDNDYALQGSIYKWLNQDIVTSDYIQIIFLFTDWSSLQADISKDNGYPKSRILPKKIPLLSLGETENFIRRKLKEIKKYIDAEEKEIPACTSEELWQNPPVYKYFKRPGQKRATKNYDNYFEANTRRIKDGGSGEVVVIPSAVKRCKYCNAISICEQAKELQEAGLLHVN